MPKFKVGVYGSAGGELEITKATKKAEKIGELLAKKHCIVITGACPGLPYQASIAAKKHGGEVWGFSPSINQKEHNQHFPEDDKRIYKKIFFVPKSFPFAHKLEVGRKYRNVVSTAYADAGIIIAGRWGTMSEFCSLHDYGKVIGVLTGTGGFAEDLPKMMKRTSKKPTAKVFFNSNPGKLVSLVVKELKKRNDNR
jgi:predicted Rossmann-fold nucleotide-binding protein